jgi:hypothetical protein
MVHIVWRERADNPWLSMAKDVVLLFLLPPPGDEAQTCGPGPFSMSDAVVARAMMKSAGYEQIELRRVDAPVLVGKDVKDAISLSTRDRASRRGFSEGWSRSRTQAWPRSKRRWRKPSTVKRIAARAAS